ncbi:MAG: TssQ family T6SS-associated lipoprotein [Pseudomonadota bacterium]|nr:TssQ family T6SS-associated lipoprotein [Pseudomonadota bacterium]
MTTSTSSHCPSALVRLTQAFAALAIVATLAACETSQTQSPMGLTDLTERPAERALMGAMRAYDDADYPAVERQANEAMKLGLRSARDIATAHKLRAFVYCTSNRLAACEAEFRAARAADPAFVLSHAEAGHPVWGPVYLRSRQ